jgi:hypothetical protein|tara:strand:+ start:183 stop:557 length:375 start_codon:yes stop_codon:yes gene_type:complete
MKVGKLNTLFLNATTSESMVVIGELEEHGHQFEVANSFQAALMSLEQKVPDLIVIDASLEFSSTNALMYIRNMFDGKIAVYGERISPATSQLLSHLGVSIIVRSISDLLPMMLSETSAPAIAAA